MYPKINFVVVLGEIFVRRKFRRQKLRLANFPFGENSAWRKFRSAKILFAEISFGKNSVGEKSFGENSVHASKQSSDIVERR